MIFFLDIILIFNFVLAYKGFRYLVSPPVLLGGGMLLASLVATMYADIWDMDSMLLESVLILGLGPLLFTLFCALFNKEYKYKAIPAFDFSKENTRKLEFLLLVSIISCIVCIYLKYRIYVNTFGSHLEFSALMFQARYNLHGGGDVEIKLPSYLSLTLSFNGMISYFTCWYLSWLILMKDRNKRLKFLLFIHLLCVAIAGLSDGDKGHMIEPALRFITIYFLCIYCYDSTHKLPSSLMRKVFVFVFVLGLSFQGLNILLGRYISGSNADMLAEYCGAEIKNFDIYMHNPSKYRHDPTWGASTFSFLYHDDLGIKRYKGTDGRFEHVNGFELGNVYTQYYSFHRDFGAIGVIVLTFITAVISMFLYNNALHSLFVKGKLNTYFFLYIMITMPLFMSFFSSNFTNRVFRTGFIRNIVLFVIFIWFFDNFIIKSKRILR